MEDVLTEPEENLWEVLWGRVAKAPAPVSPRGSPPRLDDLRRGRMRPLAAVEF